MNVNGGGANTNVNGLAFERDKDLYQMFIDAGVAVDSSNFHGQHDFSKYISEKFNINIKDIWSKKLCPDEAFFHDNTIFIVEKKWQQVAGSVDEKLQTCVFKKLQYEKVASKIGMKVVYVYLMNDWFKNPSYKDVLEFIEDSGCHYFFNEIPISFFGFGE
jgi:hypothetical protein